MTYTYEELAYLYHGLDAYKQDIEEVHKYTGIPYKEDRIKALDFIEKLKIKVNADLKQKYARKGKNQ